jgi:hypothetical protein
MQAGPKNSKESADSRSAAEDSKNGTTLYVVVLVVCVLAALFVLDYFVEQFMGFLEVSIPWLYRLVIFIGIMWWIFDKAKSASDWIDKDLKRMDAESAKQLTERDANAADETVRSTNGKAAKSPPLQ